MGKKVILTSVRLDKKLNELKESGYTFYNEIKICDTSNPLSGNDKNILKEKGVDDSYLNYPLKRNRVIFHKFS